ncbi:GNAT family N-acetyltransferase [Azonexus sp.]|uniref:GNAT family N-acetyltransferase n=1 Tax=Azonexus sp. TaxID=1872668 RepID=UPI0035B40B6B
MNRVRTAVFDHIAEVPADAWDALGAGHSLVYSRRFWEVLEHSGINDFRYRYILFFDSTERPIGIAGFYSITTDLAIFAPPGLRKLLTQLRRLMPNFLKFSILECGTPVTPGSEPFALAPDVAGDAVGKALDQTLQEIARRDGQLLIVMRDFEGAAWAHQANFEALGYHWLESLPNTYVEVTWPTPEAYIAAMRSHYRRKLLHYLAQCREQQFRYEIRDDFADLADTLHQQWQVVHEHADEYQREVLTPAFYRELAQRLAGKAKVMLFYRQETLVGHILLMLDGELMRFMFFGRHQAAHDGLWIYGGYALIETAIRLGMPRIEFGLTTYDLKQELGATISPVRMALRTTRRILNPFVGPVFRLLNRPPEVEIRHVFRKP